MAFSGVFGKHSLTGAGPVVMIVVLLLAAAPSLTHAATYQCGEGTCTSNNCCKDQDSLDGVFCAPKKGGAGADNQCDTYNDINGHPCKKTWRRSKNPQKTKDGVDRCTWKRCGDYKTAEECLSNGASVNMPVVKLEAAGATNCTWKPGCNKEYRQSSHKRESDRFGDCVENDAETIASCPMACSEGFQVATGTAEGQAKCPALMEVDASSSCAGPQCAPETDTAACCKFPVCRDKAKTCYDCCAMSGCKTEEDKCEGFWTDRHEERMTDADGKKDFAWAADGKWDSHAAMCTAVKDAEGNHAAYSSTRNHCAPTECGDYADQVSCEADARHAQMTGRTGCAWVPGCQMRVREWDKYRSDGADGADVQIQVGKYWNKKKKTGEASRTTYPDTWGDCVPAGQKKVCEKHLGTGSSAPAAAGDTATATVAFEITGVDFAKLTDAHKAGIEAEVKFHFYRIQVSVNEKVQMEDITVKLSAGSVKVELTMTLRSQPTVTAAKMAEHAEQNLSGETADAANQAVKDVVKKVKGMPGIDAAIEPGKEIGGTVPMAKVGDVAPPVSKTTIAMTEDDSPVATATPRPRPRPAPAPAAAAPAPADASSVDGARRSQVPGPLVEKSFFAVLGLVLYGAAVEVSL